MQRLPVEIQIEIIGLLDGRTLGRLCQVSKHFQNLIQHEEKSRLKILIIKLKCYISSITFQALNQPEENLVHNLDDFLLNNTILKATNNFLKIERDFSNRIFKWHEKKQNEMIKLISLGESGVGKTSLYYKFLLKQARVNATIGWDFPSRTLYFGKNNIFVNPWDTAGQQRFQSLGVAFYRGTDVVVYVMDVTSRDSLYKLPSWMEEVRNHNPAPPQEILVANKIDLPRVVTEKEVDDFAKEHHLPYIETSAKNGSNVELLFHFAALIRVLDLQLSQQDLLDLLPENIPTVNKSYWCEIL